MSTTITRPLHASSSPSRGKGRRGTRASAPPSLRFDQRLVLNRYLLGLFGASTFEELAEGLSDPLYEGWDEANVSHFHRVLAVRVDYLPRLSPPGPSREDLLRYDANIFRHTETIGRARSRRGQRRVQWKYFQYLALLFTEIYLDRFLGNPDRLLSELNAHIAAFNADVGEQDCLQPYALDDLRKLAFWMATGAGKTLLMHVNALQYRHYLDAYGRLNEITSTILLTSNEGLTAQHLNELAHSGIPAERFDRAAGRLFGGNMIQVLDVHKLAEEMGEKTVAVDAFEGNNLLFVDEGHRGAGGAQWKDRRDRLVARGFSFEYSATFGQAINAAPVAKRETLAQEYARCVLIDYSYRRFYADGYGKDYQILNLADLASADTEHLYLTASLLAFYQQQLLYAERAPAFAAYGLEHPLWVFVGSSVSRVTGTAADKSTDVLSVLRFLAHFLVDPAESVALLDRLVGGDTGLVAGGRDIFANKFPYLARRGLDGPALHAGILRLFFNAAGPARLHVEELKGTEGELALRLGDHDPFGVINVGDARALARLCADELTMETTSRELSDSLFSGLNEPGSRVHLLIGSKKFTEGWNSYRVSSLGLMNVGRGEGSQIIQLFGRGVRLRGLGGSLQRSAALSTGPHPADIALLETLNVYGLRADYMQRFKEYLTEEGLPSNEAVEEIVLPVVATLPDRPLKAIRLRAGADFLRNAPRPSLVPPPPDFLSRPIPLDYYPKLQAIESAGVAAVAPSAAEDEGKLGPTHLALIDLDAIYFEVVRHKTERGYHNLALKRQDVADLLAAPDWYALTIPAAALAFDDPHPLRRRLLWQEIATALLKKYIDRLYKSRREAYEKDFRESYVLDGTDGNLIDAWSVQIGEVQQTLLVKLRQATAEMVAGTFRELRFPPLDVFASEAHLYRPLIHVSTKDITVKPAPLNLGEYHFVTDLQAFHQANPTFFADTELYLLRNLTRGKGIGFFEAGNFYPDFLLWLLVGDRQYLSFIDPKGIRNLAGPGDPKIAFHAVIKQVEHDLADSTLVLNSFILSNTPFHQVRFWTADKAEFARHHVLFQADDRATYIETMLRTILSEPPSAIP